MTFRLARPLAAGLVATGTAIALTACGGSGAATPASSATPAPTSSASASPGTAGARGGFNSALQQQIQACLKAAGIAVPTAGTRGIRPSGAPGAGMPSGAPGAGMPSGAPGGGMPSGRPSGAPGGGYGGFAMSAEAQTALKACGITIPTGRGAGAATATTAP